MRRDRRAEILATTLTPPPEHLGVIHWFSRLLTAELGMSHSTVARVWLNLVEVCFAIIERQALGRGDLASVEELMVAIRRFCDGWNQRCRPFTWTMDADQILARLERQTIPATSH